MITKTIQQSTDLFVQFTEDELLALNIKPGDKFSAMIDNDSVLLKKFASIDIDLGDMSREVLEFLIKTSAEQDISINEVISNVLDETLKNYPND